MNTNGIVWNNLERSDSSTNFIDPRPYDPNACVAGDVHEFGEGVKGIKHPLVNPNHMMLALLNSFRDQGVR